LGQVSWSLSDGAGPQLAGSEQSFTSYSATSTTVATIVAQRNARDRLMIVLADRIVADILAGAEGL
jgi:LPS-assembly lipoprotein